MRNTFNRTSMESKLEPYDAKSVGDRLLIEPVWNRNCADYVSLSTGCFLLIEPVWNRNTRSTRNRTPYHRTFNRTSMESKLVGYLYSWSCWKAF